jgi:hypothetical protein
MSYADRMYMTYMSIAFVTVVVAFILLMLPPFKKFVSVKLVIAALITFPLVQLSIFIALDQLPKTGFVGFVSGNFMCAGIHGAGYRADCSLYEVIFEGIISTTIFSFISFGLIPLAVFSVLLFAFAAVKRSCTREA